MIQGTGKECHNCPRGRVLGLRELHKGLFQRIFHRGHARPHWVISAMIWSICWHVPQNELVKHWQTTLSRVETHPISEDLVCKLPCVEASWQSIGIQPLKMWFLVALLCVNPSETVLMMAEAMVYAGYLRKSPPEKKLTMATVSIYWSLITLMVLRAVWKWCRFLSNSLCYPRWQRTVDGVSCWFMKLYSREISKRIRCRLHRCQNQ